MKLKLGLIITVLFVAGILVSPTFCQEQPAQHQSKDTVSNDTASDSAVSTAGGVPHIFFPDTTFDFGEVTQKQSLTHVFKVQNTGDALLKIISARAS
jgi:hypothetical protein